MLKIHINKHIKTAYYIQLRDSIVRSIENNTLKHLDKLPTEKDICEVFNLSRTVVRKAYSLLEDEGYIKTIQGQGSIVTKRKTFNFNLDYFLNNHDAYTTSNDLNMFLLLIDEQKDFAYITYNQFSFLGTKNGDPILYQKIFFIDGVYDFDFSKIDYSYLFNNKVFSFNNRLLLNKATTEQSQLLAVEKNAPILYIVTTVSENDNVVGYIETYLPTEYVSLEVIYND